MPTSKQRRARVEQKRKSLPFFKQLLITHWIRFAQWTDGWIELHF